MADLLPISDWLLWSMQEQLRWVEQLSAEDLKNWLREITWTQTTTPLTASRTSTLITYLSGLLRKGSPPLFTRVRTIVPELLQEWGSDDPGTCLVDMLILCGTLRCASAEPTVVMIATERLKGRADEVELRQRCLSVLSGFGVTGRTLHLFRRYIGDISYAALCYRALYRYDLSYAARELPTLISVHRVAGRVAKLSAVLNILFFEHLDVTQRAEVWRDVLKLTDPRTLGEVLGVLQSLNIVLAVPFHPSAPQEIEVLYGYSSEQPHTGGDKIDTADIGNEKIVVITRALERFLLTSNRVGRAVMATAAG